MYCAAIFSSHALKRWTVHLVEYFPNQIVIHVKWCGKFGFASASASSEACSVVLKLTDQWKQDRSDRSRRFDPLKTGLRSCYDFSDFAILCVSWKCQPQMQPGRGFFHFLSSKWTKISKVTHILPHRAWQVSFPTQLSWKWLEDWFAHQHRPPQPTIPPHPPKLNFHLKEPQINLKVYLNNIKNNNNNKNNINNNSNNNNNNNQTKILIIGLCPHRN